jgi:hypothetical protein
VNGLKVVVLKFGSSVLASAADLTCVTDECYRHLREGKRVLAVVSAIVRISTRKWTCTVPVEKRDFRPSAVSIRKAQKWTSR